MILKSLSAATMACILMLGSCSKNNEALNSMDVEIISSESLSEACTAEVSEMSVVIFSNINDSQLGSTPASIPDVSLIDSLMTGASIAISGTGGMDNPQGTITIDFKTGTTDHHGVIRKGKLMIAYSGRRGAEGSSRSISFSGYSRNNVKLDDNTNYLITNLSDSSTTTRDFHHMLTGCKLTFPDQKTFIRKKTEFIASIDFVLKTTSILASDTTSSGTTRYGTGFVTKIANPLIYKSQCISSKLYLPNEGTKYITVGSSTYIVVYGSTHTCGQTVKVTAGDKSATVTVNSDGN